MVAPKDPKLASLAAALTSGTFTGKFKTLLEVEDYVAVPSPPQAKVDDDLKVFSGTPASGEGLHLSMGAALVKALAPEPKMTKTVPPPQAKVDDDLKVFSVKVAVEAPLKFVDVNFHLGPKDCALPTPEPKLTFADYAALDSAVLIDEVKEQWTKIVEGSADAHKTPIVAAIPPSPSTDSADWSTTNWSVMKDAYSLADAKLTAMHFDYKKKQTVTLPLDGLSPELLNTLMSDFGAHLSEHDAHKIAKAWEAASLDFPLVGVGPDTCIPTHMCVVCGLKFLTTPVTQGKTFGAKTATCGMACWKKHKAASIHG